MIKYLIYLIKHKYYVFIECFKMGLFIHAFTHDLSKFLPDEFFPYAAWVYGKYGKQYYDKWANYEYGYDETIDISREVKKKFEKAWEKHYIRNKHHPENYDWKHNFEYTDFVLNMPVKYLKQMACDLKAMSRQFKNDPIEWFLKNKEKFEKQLTVASLRYLEELLSGKKK